MTFDISKERKRAFYEMKNMLVENNHRKILGYLLVQRVILFLAFYEYLNRLLHEYDRSGKPRTTIKTVDGVNYQIDTTYDELGRVVSLRYPDNETVGYDYDSGGNLTGAGGFATYVGFNALGQAGSINYGNGVSTTLQYYSSNNRGE